MSSEDKKPTRQQMIDSTTLASMLTETFKNWVEDREDSDQTVFLRIVIAAFSEFVALIHYGIVQGNNISDDDRKKMFNHLLEIQIKNIEAAGPLTYDLMENNYKKENKNGK